MMIGERVRKLRKMLDLTQREFGERINLKSNSVALIEGGRNTSDQTIASICREFNVNEVWLRTGDGEMFIPAPTSELDALASRYPNMTHETYVLVEKLVNLPKASQDIITGFLREVVEGFGDVRPGTLAKAPQKMSREEILAEVERQLDEEEETRNTSSDSGYGNSGTATG